MPKAQTSLTKGLVKVVFPGGVGYSAAHARREEVQAEAPLASKETLRGSRQSTQASSFRVDMPAVRTFSSCLI